MVTHGRNVLRGVVLLALFLVMAGCTGRPEPAPEAVAKAAPDFTLFDLDGSPVRLSDSQGQVRLIDFWATWCAPCKEEIPWLKEMHRTYGEKGFKILAISEENVKIVRDFVEAREIPYTNLVGTEGMESPPGDGGDSYEETASSYMVLSLPTAFLVDGEGRIVIDFRGTKSKKILEGKVRELLGLPPLLP